MTRRPADDRGDLVRSIVSGSVAPARIPADPPVIDRDGRLTLLPGNGGIALGVHAGDRVVDFRADHLMVGASIEDAAGVPAAAGPLHQLACIGNRVRNDSGQDIGVVAGKRGGLAPGFIGPQLVSVEVPDAFQDAMRPGGEVTVEAVGRGLSLPDHADVVVLNVAPWVLDELPLEETEDGLVMPVRATAPGRMAGPGVGQDSWIGDVEIADASWLESVPDLRFGDLVALADLDGRVSRFPRAGHVTVGVVSHGPSPMPGHGVGVTVVLSGPSARIAVPHSDEASLGGVLRAAGERAMTR